MFSRHLAMRAAVVVATLICAGAPSDLRSQSILDSDDLQISPNTVVVRRTVDVNYDADTSATARSLTGSLQRVYAVQPGDTLSAIVAKEFGVDAKRHPGSYPQFSASIQQENGLPSPDTLAAGQELYIPDLPAANKRHGALWAFICTTQTFGRMQKCDASPQVRIAGPGSTVVQLRTVTPSVATELLKRNGEYEVEAAPIQVSFADADPPLTAARVVADFLLASERELLTKRLARPAQAPVTLFVLDDGWPDQQSYLESRAFLLDAFRRVREHFKLGPGDPALGQAGSAANIPVGTHAAKIKEALQPLVALDLQSAHVPVIYVPLFRYDKRHEEILRELVEVHLTAQYMKTTLDVDAATERIRQAARKNARDYVSRIGNERSTVISDQVVLEALSSLARHLGEIGGQPFLMNFSWTVPNLQFTVALPSDARGLYVAAAGNEFNDSGITVFQTRRQLAYRSSQPGDVLAVMNVDRVGAPACRSSLLDVDGTALVLAFDGKLPSGDCGTSFAAPRVAWLIAARESMRIHDPKKNWVGKLQNELRALRRPEQNDYNKIRFNLETFYQVEN